MIQNILGLTREQDKGTLLAQIPLPITVAPSLEELEKYHNTVSRTGHIQNTRKNLLAIAKHPEEEKYCS